MRRILIGECKQETSSFNPRPTEYDDFVIEFGEDVIQHHRQVRNEVGGALRVFDSRPDLEIIPTFSARAITSGGAVRAAAFDRMLGEFLAAVQSAPRPDGVFLSLHGAMVAENEDDTEGRIVAEIRKIAGPHVPITVSLDLHGILTDRMLEQSDAIAVYHTYPHIDFAETGERAARLLLRLMDREIRPVTARVRVPALVRGDELITATGLYGRSIRHAKRVENGPKGLSGAMFIGNPFTDVPDLASNAVIVTDNDPDLASREALEMARDFWALREKLQANLTSLQESIQIAAGPHGRVVLMDAADATSSGAPGDSNAILRGLVEIGSTRTALIPIVDQAAVEAAYATGPGWEIDIEVGGSIDKRFRPLPLSATVLQVFDGQCPSESDGSIWNAGKTAVLVAGPITLIATSRPMHLYDRSLFLACGQEPSLFDIVVVKSPHCQPHFFAYAEHTVNVDAPGATSANLPTLGHRCCRRPIFPLERDTPFEPEVKLFRSMSTA